jgi:nucleoside-diphosphate-sugar epimerase
VRFQAIVIGGSQHADLRNRRNGLHRRAFCRARDGGGGTRSSAYIAVTGRAIGLVSNTCARMGLKPPIYRRRMDFYLNDAAFDSELAQSVLGWRPKVDLAEGFAATLEASRPPGSSLAQAYVFFSLLTLLAADPT